jgi:hypothetical protein
MLKRALLSILAVSLTCAIAMAQVNVLTYHNDIQRTGWNSQETKLTLDNVNVNTFGKVGFLTTSDRVRTTPLYVSNISINNSLYNVVFVEDDSANVYAFDADRYSVLWQASALGPGEQKAPFMEKKYCGDSGDSGIVGTPVIDLTAGPHGAIYFVAASYNPNIGGGTWYQRLHALDLTTGAELFGNGKGTDIQAKYPGTGDNSDGINVLFDPSQYFVRAALTEVNNPITGSSIYFGFASLCDQRPYTGWLMQYSATTLQQQSVINFTPNGYGGSVWAAGTGFASDGGYLYVPLANGAWGDKLDGNGKPADQDYGNSFVKVSTQIPMTVADFFTMWNADQENQGDEDLGSGGSIVLDIPRIFPNPSVPLAIAAGKDSFAYLCRRDAMGRWNGQGTHNDIYELLVGDDPQNPGALKYGIWGAPAFFNGTIYWGPIGKGTLLGGFLKAFPFQADGYLPQSPTSTSSIQFPYPGTTPSISSYGMTNGIVWTVENDETPGINPNSVLHAYYATDLGNEIYNSSQNLARDGLGFGNHFVTPMIANGKVYVTTRQGVQVFGLFHP